MKINRLVVFIIISVSSISFQSLGQTPQQNLDKYWSYRTRFFNTFIIDKDWLSSPRTGINIPAGIFNPAYNQGRDNTISWGDSEENLSFYMGAMATEYQLQNLANQDLTNVKSKIHRSLKALERLDWEAENFYGCGFPDPPCFTYTNRNGFFMRDDLDLNIFTSYWRPEKYNDGYWPNDLDLKSDFNSEVLGGHVNEMSQDMIWHLMMGYSLVAHFLADDTEYFDGYDCESLYLSDMAKRQVQLMHKYIKSVSNNDPWDPIAYGGLHYPGTWNYNSGIPVYRIKNPCHGDTVHRGGSVIDLRYFAKLFRDASLTITQGAFGDESYVLSSYPLFEPSFDVLLPYVWYNTVGRLILSTIADYHFADNLDNLLFNIRKFADFYNKNISGNPLDIKYFTLEHLPMIHFLLHNEPMTNNLWHYYFSHVEQLLDEAPAGGPYCDFFPPTNRFAWTAPNTFDRPIGQFISESGNDRLIGQYNGLDYMLLFNLYMLTYQSGFNDPININYSIPTLYSYDSYDFEYGTNTINIGNENNAAYFTLTSKDQITMNSTVHANGRIRLRGNEVLLQPGFEVVSGGEFIAENLESMNLDFSPPPGGLKGAMVIQNSSNDNLSEELFDNNTADQINDHLQIYPNPASDFIFINANNLYTEITIYDSNGLIVTRTFNDGNETYSVDVSGFNSGIYIVKVTSDDGQSEFRKLIIE